MELRIEYVPKEELKPYVGNAKLHPAEQVEQIKNSIREFGFNDPIAVWHDNEVIEGHGRLLAVMEMDEITNVPVIRLDEMTDEQRRAYMIVHNKLTMNTDFDFDMLQLELDNIGIDMEKYGFSVDDLDVTEPGGEDKYTTKANIPQYEPTGEFVGVYDLVNADKRNELIEEINASEIAESEKVFLREAANRHLVFNYRNIAEYYATASKETQELMEKSALVIIDIDNAIANGYAKLSEQIRKMRENG